MSVSNITTIKPPLARQLENAHLWQSPSDLKILCLALRVQNGFTSPPDAPKIWTEQIKHIDKFYDQHNQFPVPKEKLIESLEKTEKFKREHLGEILKFKQLPDRQRNDSIKEWFKTADECELVRHLIYQPFPEKPSYEYKVESNWENEEFLQSSNKTSGFFSSLLNKIAAICICGGLWFNKEEVQKKKRNWRTYFETLPLHTNTGENRLLLENYELHPIEITTPDGATIRGTYFKNRNSQKTVYRPTIITCNPSGGLFMYYTWMLAPSAGSKEYDVINFDYRGCGDSDGFPSSSNALYLDAECVYQFVREHRNLAVQEDDIHLYGHSLGGNVWANVQANHSTRGRLVIDRSFSQLTNVIINLIPLLPEIIAQHIFDSPKLLVPAAILLAAFISFFAPITSSLPPIVSLLFSKPSLLAPFIEHILSLLNWQMEGQKAADRATDGCKLIVYHKEDPLMQDPAGLEENKNGFEYLNLNEYSNIPLQDIHKANLQDFDKQNQYAWWKVLNFLHGIRPTSA